MLTFGGQAEGAGDLLGHPQRTIGALLYACRQLSLSLVRPGPHAETLHETAASTQCALAFLAPSEGNFSSHTAAL